MRTAVASALVEARFPRNWNWKEPDYAAAYAQRIERVARMRADPSIVADLKAYYRENIPDFIHDWGVTVDPRLVERGLPGVIPFLLFDRQREFVEWVIKKWREGRRGLCEKARDEGISWLCVGTAAALCVFYDHVSVGFGSRTEPYVDKIGEPKSLFYKGRAFMENLPWEFRAGWSLVNAPFMRMHFPDTGSHWTGEVGKNIGRGDRTSLYFYDEGAHNEHAQSNEASLSATTNCRIDVSSVNGMNNVFAKNRHGGKIDVFVIRWEEDPRKTSDGGVKDRAWYDAQCEDLDPVIVAQEIDRDYTASVEGIVIPGVWVRAAVDAFEKLGIVPAGAEVAALDVADEGADLNAWGRRKGVELIGLEEWAGRGSDLYATVQRAFMLCEAEDLRGLRYDADGLGAGVRGDARIINERRREAKVPLIHVIPFRGSGAVIDPTQQVYPAAGRDAPGRTNEDFFKNAKAQAWWSLRERFRKTWRWVSTLGTDAVKTCPHDEIISLNSRSLGRLLAKLTTELSQPTYSLNGAGQVVVEKSPDGMKSPNLGDVVMMLYAKLGPARVEVTQETLAAIRAGAAASRLRRLGRPR